MNRPLFLLIATIGIAIGLVAAARMFLPPSSLQEPKIVERFVTPEMVAANETVSYMSISGNTREQMTIVAAPLHVVLSTPSWIDFPDNPPLSLPEAVKIARLWHKKRGHYAPTIYGVNLQEKPRGSKKWAYTIYFDPNTDQKMTKGREPAYVVVLFDGSVVGSIDIKPQK